MTHTNYFKSGRVLFLLLIACIALICRGVDVFVFVTDQRVELRRAGWSWDGRIQGLTVIAVPETLSGGEPGPAFQAGLRKGDVVTAIYNDRGEGRRIRGLSDYYEIEKLVPYGKPWEMVVRREGTGQEVRLKMPPLTRPASGLAQLKVRGLSILIFPLLTLITAFLIGFMKPQDDNAFTASLLFVSFSTIFGTAAPLYPHELQMFGLIFQGLANSFLAFLFARFFLLFPSPSWIARKIPWLSGLFLVITVLCIPVVLFELVAQFTSFALLIPLKKFDVVFGPFFAVTLAVIFTVGLASLVMNTVKAGSKDERRRMTIMLSGTMASVLPAVGIGIYSLETGLTPPLWVLFLALAMVALFPATFAYVVIKHRVMGIRFIIRRGLQYTVVSRGYRVGAVLVTAVVLFFFSAFFFQKFMPNPSPWTVLAYTVLLATAVTGFMARINRPVVQAIDRKFFRNAYNAQQVLTELSRAVRQLSAQPEKLLELVSSKISESLFPDQVAIFVRDAEARLIRDREEAKGPRTRLPETEGGDLVCVRRSFRAASGRDTVVIPAPSESLRLPAHSFIARYLEGVPMREHSPADVYLDDPSSWTGVLARVDSKSDPRYQERLLLEELNTRLIVPLISNDRVLGFLSLGEKLSEEPYSTEDKELLATVAEQAAIAMDYAKLINQVAEQEKLSREIEIAKEVQEHLFPQILPEMKTLDYTGVCKAARGVGGDYYDFLLLSSGQLGIALADVAGKGISASLLMASLQASLRSQAPARLDRLSELISEVNRLLCDSTASNRYATFFYGLYNDTGRRLTYVNAGHNPPLVFRKKRSAGEIKSWAAEEIPGSTALAIQREQDPAVVRLETGGTVVGLFTDSVYEQATLQLESGDIMVLFSDGVSEAMNEAEEEFGEERLKAVITSHLGRSAAELQDEILNAVDRFVGSAPQHDDITLVVARVV